MSMGLTRRGRRRLALLAVVVGVVAVLGAAGVAALSAQRARAVETKRRKGLEAYEQGRFSEALTYLGTVFARRPDDLEIALAIAQARRRVPLANNRHLVSSLGYARAALDLDPDNLEALRVAMEDAQELGQYTELLSYAERILEQAPQDAEAHALRVRALAAMGRDDEAVQAALAMRRARPDDPQALELWIAASSVAGADDQTLLAEAEQAAAAHADDAGFAALLADLRWRSGDVEGAQDAARSAAQAEIRDARTLAAVVQALDRTGLGDEADALAQRLVESIADADHAQAAVVALERAWRLGDLAEAQRLARQALERVDVATAQVDLLGWLRFLLGQQADGEGGADDLTALDEALRTHSSPTSAYWRTLLEGVEAFSQGRHDQAREAFQDASLRRPDEALPRFLLAQALVQLGELESAANLFGRLAQTDPTWYGARRMHAATLLDLGRVEEAHLAAQLLLAAHPRRVDAALLALRTGAALVETQGDSADAVTAQALRDLAAQLQRQFAADQPAVALAADLQQARIAAAQGDHQAVLQAIERAEAQAGQAPVEDLLALARTCRRFGAPGEARLLALARRRAPRSPQVLYALALAAAQSGDVEAGRALLEEAAAQAQGQERVEIERRLALFLSRMEAPEALEALRRFAERRPHDARAQIALLQQRSAWFDRALVEEALGRLKSVLGESSTAWRTFEARRLLTFEPSQASAAEAVQLLADIVLRTPENAAASALYAQAQLMLDHNVRAAAEALGRTLDAEPGQAGLYPTLILALRELGRLDEARRRFERFAAIEPLSEELRRRRAELALALDQPQAAVEDWRRLAERTGAAADLLRLAQALEAAGQTGEAHTVYRRVAQASDAGVNELLAAAAWLARKGQAGEADAPLERALAMAGEEAPLVRAAFAMQVGDTAGAEKALEQAAGAGAPRVRAALAAMRLRRGEVEEAAAVLEEGQAEQQEDPALRRLGRLLRLARTGGWGLQAAQTLLASAGDLTQALGLDKALTLLEELRPESPSSWRTLAGGLQQLLRNDSAAAAMEGLWLVAVEALARAQQLDDAAALAREGAGRFPSSVALSRSAAQLLALAGRHEEALAMARIWSSLDQRPEPVVFLADMQTRLQRPQQALATLEPVRRTILERTQEDPQAALVLLRALAAAGRTNEVVQLLTTLAQQDASWWARGASLAAQAPVQAASALLEAVQAQAPDVETPSLAFALAAAWQDVGGRGGGAEAFAKAVELLAPLARQDELSAAGALVYAASLEALGRLDEAQRWYRQALAQDPSLHAAANNLAYLLVRQSSDPAEAVALARQAVEQAEAQGVDASTLANYLDTLGAALLASGKAQEAVQAYQRSIDARQPPLAVAQLGLAEALAALGRLDEAREALRIFRARASLEEQRALAERLEALADRLGRGPSQEEQGQ